MPWLDLLSEDTPGSTQCPLTIYEDKAELWNVFPPLRDDNSEVAVRQ